MSINLKSVGAITRINFVKTTWIAYLVAILCFLSSLIQSFVYFLIDQEGASQTGEGNNLLLALILAAILIPAVNFRKIINLNGKKVDFFWASLINYAILAGIISLTVTTLNLTIDNILGTRVEILDIINIFGWTNNGLLFTFLRQFAFYMLLAVTIHTLTAIQTFWWGWVTDLILVAIISVFTPIEMLRKLLVAFFNVIIFNPNPIPHIAVCVALAAVIYSLNIPILSRKKI